MMEKALALNLAQCSHSPSKTFMAEIGTLKPTKPTLTTQRKPKKEIFFFKKGKGQTYFLDLFSKTEDDFGWYGSRRIF